MRVIIQRVSKASVEIDGIVNGKIDKGLVILVGINCNDNEETIDWVCRKIVGLRIFSDENDKMNLSITDVNGSILLISNFTLYGKAQKGFRPSFSEAARPEIAINLYNIMLEKFRNLGIITESGIFGAMMQVSLINDGPVTIILEK